MIIFDWDDTLMPTWYIEEVLKPCGVTEVTPSSSFYAGMRKHAEVVESLLRAAREVACVAIVTLAQRPWVNTSAASYLPGLCIEDLCKELDITVYYATEHVPVEASYIEAEEMDINIVAKWRAMSKFVKRITKHGDKVSHAVSIGDSNTEAEALKEIMWSKLHRSNSTTVRLLQNPSLEELTDELKFLLEACPHLVCGEGDAEFDIDNPQDIEAVSSLLEANAQFEY